MTKTVKEIIKDRISYFKTVYEGRLYLIKNEILILENILQAYENVVSEKDKEHKEQLKRMHKQFQHDKELEIGQYKFEIEQQQLYKEDFVVSSYCINCLDELFIIDNMRKRN